MVYGVLRFFIQTYFLIPHYVYLDLIICETKTKGKRCLGAEY
jgi:hypothetical protein